MKRTAADLADAPWLSHRRVAITRRSDDGFTAHVCLVCLDAVREPRWADRDGTAVCLADDGYVWVHHVPYRALSAVTTIFEPTGALVECRVDLCKATGVTMNGVPWFEPLPLHLAISPDHSAILLGRDALDAALAARKVTPQQHADALGEADRITRAIDDGNFVPRSLAARHRAELLLFAG